MEIRIGLTEEMQELWENSNSPTYRYFTNGMQQGNIEFWTVEDENSKELVGELYIFWDSEDKDEANGKGRAYLCAFRIHKDYRGLGYGKKLMMTVLDRVRERGFNEVTIGVDNDDVERLTSMYSRWGFSELIKYQYTDYHYIGKNGKPVTYEVPFGLYLNKLGKGEE